MPDCILVYNQAKRFHIILLLYFSIFFDGILDICLTAIQILLIKMEIANLKKSKSKKKGLLNSSTLVSLVTSILNLIITMFESYSMVVCYNALASKKVKFVDILKPIQCKAKDCRLKVNKGLAYAVASLAYIFGAIILSAIIASHIK